MASALSQFINGIAIYGVNNGSFQQVIIRQLMLNPLQVEMYVAGTKCVCTVHRHAQLCGMASITRYVRMEGEGVCLHLGVCRCACVYVRMYVQCVQTCSFLICNALELSFRDKLHHLQHMNHTHTDTHTHTCTQTHTHVHKSTQKHTRLA